MRKLVIAEYVTLDGVMQDPGGAEGFAHGGWHNPYFNDELAAIQRDGLFASDALLLGRVTYEGFAAAWPSVTDETGFANRMNNLPKYVASTTLGEVAWNNSRVIEGDVAAAVAELKRQPGGDILVYGSGTLVQMLMDHDLVDEYRLMVFPVVVGSGKRLFKEGSDAALHLVDSTTTGTGVVILTYRPAHTDGEG
jgi:dihydrofolate reductase